MHEVSVHLMKRHFCYLVLITICFLTTEHGVDQNTQDDARIVYRNIMHSLLCLSPNN